MSTQNSRILISKEVLAGLVKDHHYHDHTVIAVSGEPNVPMSIRWADGAEDDFADRKRSLANRARNLVSDWVDQDDEEGGACPVCGRKYSTLTVLNDKGADFEGAFLGAPAEIHCDGCGSLLGIEISWEWRFKVKEAEGASKEASS